MSRKAYKIEWKASSRSRKVNTGIQFHETEAAAKSLVLIRDHNPEAVCVSCRELNAEELAILNTGVNP